jgi:hypothetical protein
VPSFSPIFDTRRSNEQRAVVVTVPTNAAREKMNRSEDERTAIFSKPLLGSQSYGRTYGSAGRNSFSSVSVKPRKHIVKHEVKRTDTIQGLALKYGVTVRI